MVMANRIVWKGSVREVTAEIRRLAAAYPLLADLIQARLH
jgi:hypothetical protein